MTLFEQISSLQNSFFLIAGPCAIEDEDTSFSVARLLKKICEDLQIPFIFKASYRKANRTSVDSFTGIGDARAIEILSHIRKDLNVPVTTDVHEVSEAKMVSPHVDVIQIPAFLCRQTALLQAAADTGKVVNVKKGQFMSGESMRHAVTKIKKGGNEKVLLTERGNSFGYNDLVVDMRNIPIMQSHGVPVVLDCTHANQRPNQSSGVTGGTAQYIETLAKAGVAAGANGIFIETHPDPQKALSDGANMLALSEMNKILKQLVKLKKALV